MFYAQSAVKIILMLVLPNDACLCNFKTKLRKGSGILTKYFENCP
jgi:hypothetical protein